MTLLDSGLRAAAAAAGPRIPPSSLRLRLPPRATTMSEFLLALLTLSGLLPVAKVLTMGADRVGQQRQNNCNQSSNALPWSCFPSSHGLLFSKFHLYNNPLKKRHKNEVAT